jgi:hypothetical protein
LTSDSGTKQGRRPTICLFEWNTGGHFPVWARAAAEALEPDAKVILAASDPLIEDLSDLGVETYSLGAPRPSIGGGDLTATDTPAELARRELGLVREVCAAVRPDHCLHLFTDPVMRWWLREEPMPARMTATIFHPIAHLPSAYGVRLSTRHRLQGAYLEHKVRRWRARPDAHAVFCHDPIAAGRWARQSGAQARWLPEPLVPPPLEPRTRDREGCALYGAIHRRKGFDLLADALSLSPTDLRVTVAGHVSPAMHQDFESGVARMRQAGNHVEIAISAGGEVPAPADVLVRARCAVLPYRPHLGISRVLMEAAAVGTPVVGPAWGANGWLIREYGLGLTVDPEDPVALREAILQLTEDPDAAAAYAPALARYAEERSGAGFRREVRSVFGLTAARRSDPRTRPTPASGRSPG